MLLLKALNHSKRMHLYDAEDKTIDLMAMG